MSSNLHSGSSLGLNRYGIGQAVLRKEDTQLVRGKGRYSDDKNQPKQLYAYFLRSSHAHGVIRSIDIEAAKAMPGVHAIYTGADMNTAGYGTLECKLPLKNRDGSPLRQTHRTLLASDKVRFVGDPIAYVIADTALQARDAAEAIAVDIDPLPVIVTPEDAIKPGAPLVYDDVPGNVVLDYHFGDSEKVAEAFAKAACTVSVDLLNTRLVVNPMEPRAALATYDKKARAFTIHMPTQGVTAARLLLSKDLLKIPAEDVRIISDDVGGSFGMKFATYPEYACIMHAARELGRPVKWTDERSTSFVSDHHGRATQTKAELALDAKGHFLATRYTGFGDMGAFMSAIGPLMPTINILKNSASVYATPLIELNIKCVLTNKTNVGAYRGAGRPEGNYYMERLIELAAAKMKIDPADLRRRNFIKPSDMPYKSASDSLYDSGDFPAVFEEALKRADYAGFTKRKRESKKSGKLRGIAITSFLEVTAPPNVELGKIRFEADGSVSFVTGTFDYGQGHRTTFAQVLSEKLGVPFERINVIQNDSNDVTNGGGSGGSRSMAASGAAMVEAVSQVITYGKEAAAYLFDARPEAIEFRDGEFLLSGTNRGINVMDLAKQLRDNKDIPDGVPKSLNAEHTVKGIPSVFPNGCHVGEVEIDPETGIIEIVRYSGVNDFGVIVNPMIVDGQVHGGIVQGLGQALMEHAVYDENGQLVTGSFMDYAMPRASDAPVMTFASHPSPATTNPLGVKGCGEAGCAGSLPTVMNAVMNALAEFDITHIDMPLTPEKIWRAIHDAKVREKAHEAA